MGLHTGYGRELTLRAHVTGCPDHRSSKVHIFVSRAVRAPTLLAMHQRDIFLDMFRLIGTVLIGSANKASLASTRHGNMLYSALDGGTKSELATGTADSDTRRKVRFSKQ